MVGRERRRVGNFDISNKQGEGLRKVEIEVFLTKWGKMEKLTSDGYSFGTREPIYFTFLTKTVYPCLYFNLVINSP